MISIICCSNDEQTLKEMLISSLEKQINKDYELIIVDAKKHNFISASQSLNYGIKQSHGEIIMICHQDIKFLDSDFLNKVVLYVKNNPKAIFGLAGCGYDHIVYSTVKHGKNKKYAGTTFDEIKSIQTLDEVCIFFCKDNFYGFSEENKTWHLYGTQLCLDNIKRGNENFVIPSNVYHKSSGNSMNNAFFIEYKRICKIYNDVKFINTTMLILKNNAICLFFGILYKKIKRFIKRILKITND
ncbi:MAG: glycosyltransferase family 2 protein [Anaeroplasma sp.]|nr:glycosyltransferase family 2 protein [Anaeroplasma sp.]